MAIKAAESGKQRPEAVKLACHHVWKVYGADPGGFFTGGAANGVDAAGLCQQILDAQHIVAACDVNFEIMVGEIFVIMGLSGSGKSTMVRCLSRLVEPTAGQVLLDGQDLLQVPERELIEIRRHKMGMVFQNFGLLPHQTVLENVAFPLKVQGVKRPQREARAREVIELVGLEGRESSFPRELSGGQQQRVGIARSLAVEPEVWFLDEPFSALDPLIRRQMQDEFLRLQRMLHKTIVFITHDFLEALRIGDRIAIMKDGRVVQQGTPAEVVMHPADAYVAEFTKDVPRVRVITAGDIAEPAGAEIDGAEGVSATASLEAVLPRLAGRAEGIAVLGADGQVIGRVTPGGVVAALADSEAAS